MGIKKDQNKGKLSKQWKILIILVAIVLVIFGYFKMFNRSENIVESNKTSEVTKVTDNKTYSASLLACEAIDYKKIGKITSVAKHYLLTNNIKNCEIRFDVIEVYFNEEKINHIENAF